MPLSRAEVGNMSGLALELAADRLRGRLAEDWRKGQPGKLTDIYDLALVYAEAAIRGLPLPQPAMPGQLQLDIGECASRRSPTLQ